MEPETVWLPDAVCIKQEPEIDIKEEEPEHEAENMGYLPHSDMVQEQLNSKIKHENNENVSEDDDHHSSVTIGNECYDTEENADLVMKFEEGPDNITFQTSESEGEFVTATSGVPSSTGNCANAISQQTGVALRLYSCGVCNKKFKKLFQLQKHTIAHQVDESAKLSFGSITPNVQVQKNDDGLDQSQHMCDICKKSFTRSGVLIRHMRIHTGQRPYSCEVCNKTFTQSGNLKIHMRTHTGHRPFSCNTCNKSFSQSGDLNKHMITHTGQRPFSCEICNKSYSQLGSLNLHMQTHTGQRPYSCKICNKSFSLRGYLNTHLGTHTGLRPYTCEICNKSFTRREHLNTHIRSHTGVRPYSCEVCNKSFTDRGILNTHMRTHTGQRPFSCKICNESFKQRCHLDRHMAKHRPTILSM